ncbi:MAG: tellurite resistance TerB family protein [Pseudomonadota bacterium]
MADGVEPESSWTVQDGLVAAMVCASISDQQIKVSELLSIERIVNHLPIFFEYDLDRMRRVSDVIFELMDADEGLDAFFGLVRNALPERLYETAYALCCDVAAADGLLKEQELRFLQEMRYELNIDRLAAAAIERGARARHTKL